MNIKQTLCSTLIALASLVAVPASAVESGADFMLGTWTRDGDCKEGDVITRAGAQYRSRIRGQNYLGTVEREGDVIKTTFASEEGNTRRYIYRVDGDNRIRVIDFSLCDQVHCEQMHVQSYLYFMRCAE